MNRARAVVGLVAVVAAGALLLSGGSGADPETPDGLPGMPPPFLGVAVLGDGGLTAAVDAYGNVVELRAPGPAGRALIENPAERQVAGTVPADTGIQVRVRPGDGPALPMWRADEVWQRYLPETNVLRTVARFGSERVRIEEAIHGGRLAVVTDGGTADVQLRVNAAGGGVTKSREVLDKAAASDRRWLRASRPLGSEAPPWADEMYERSLLVLHALIDRRTGAVAAGARDGWAYVWPRDAAAVAMALAATGHRGEAESIVRFLLGAGIEQAARFNGDGSPAPGRAAQGDAIGWVAAAAKAAGIAGSARQAARILAGGQPIPWRDRPDYWEQAPGDYLGNALASVDGPKIRLYVGKSARRLVRRVGDPESGLDSAAAWGVRPFPHPGLYPAIRRTLNELVAAGGRFGITPGEGWDGGEDPWSAPTAWTAWSLAALGERRQALRLMQALRRSATPAGMLPERVDAETGVPRSTTPLAWSHAFAILALRELWPRAQRPRIPGRNRFAISLQSRECRGDRLPGGLGHDDTGAAAHALAAVQLPAAQGDDLVADDAGEADLRERPPLATDCDHRLAGGDDGKVAGVADAGGDDMGAVLVRVLRRLAGNDPDHGPARLSRRPRGRLHHPATAAADQGDAGLGQPPPHLFGQPPGLRALLGPARPDHRHLSLLHSSPRINPISSKAPALCSGSFRLPHFGLWTQEGQPDSQGHSAIRRSASPSRRSNSS